MLMGLQKVACRGRRSGADSAPRARPPATTRSASTASVNFIRCPFLRYGLLAPPATRPAAAGSSRRGVGEAGLPVVHAGEECRKPHLFRVPLRAILIHPLVDDRVVLGQALHRQAPVNDR